MNESQRFYINTTLEMLGQQWKEANGELEEIYKQYSKDRQALKDKLSKVMMEFNIKEEYMDIKAAERAKINKELQQAIRGIVESEKAKETEKIKKSLTSAIKNGYKYKEYLLGLGIDFNLLPLSEKEITKIVNQKIKGELWSNRLWTNKKDLEIILRKSCDDFIKGKISVNKIGQQIRANFETDYHKSQRLARTELARVQGAISDKFDKEHEIEWQLWISTLDGKTSKKCRGLDGTQYRIDDKNKPSIPFHPNCRSCLVGIPSKDYKPRTRRDNETGDIIDYVTYDDWKNGVKPVKKDKEGINKNGQKIVFDLKGMEQTKQEKVKEVITRLNEQFNTRLIGVTKEKTKKGVKGEVGLDFKMNLATTKTDTIVHEFMHSISMTKADKLGLTNDKEFWKEIKKVRTKYNKDIAKNIEKKISSYADESIDEFVAEAFAHSYLKNSGELGYEYGKNFEYSDLVMKIVKKYFGK